MLQGADARHRMVGTVPEEGLPRRAALLDGTLDGEFVCSWALQNV